MLHQFSPAWSQGVFQHGTVPIPYLACLPLIALHQGRVPCNVGEHDGSEVPLLFFDHGDLPLGPGGSWIDLRHI
jgi:hypothetical protein